MHNPRGETSIWGRATGKSTKMAWQIKKIMEEMPRSLWVIVGRTFRDMLKNTLPTTIGALEDIGIIKGKDFFVSRRAPASWEWPEPFRPPLEPEHVIWTRTGAAFLLLSQDRESSNRGGNYDGIICDEGLNLIRERFEKEIVIANRGSLKRFAHIPYHHAIYIYSSMPYADGRWLLEHGAYYKESGIDNSALQRKIISLEIEMLDSDNAEHIRATWKKVKELKQQLRWFKNKNGFLYTEADIFDNMSNIGFHTIRSYRKILMDLVFRVECLNEKIIIGENSFYPSLNPDKHLYTSFNYSHINGLLGDSYDYLQVGKSEDCRQDIDALTNYDPDRPLELAWDIGAAINFLVVSQEFYNEIRIIDSRYVLSPKILDHLFHEFNDYYQYHRERRIYLHYDPATGNARKDNSTETSAEQAMRILTGYKWNVIPMTSWGSNIYHEEKYQLINKVLLEDDPRFPKIRINAIKCQSLLLSMSNSKIVQGFKGFKKDKSIEAKASVPREQATDGSDAFDILLYGKLIDLWQGGGFSTPVSTS